MRPETQSPLRPISSFDGARSAPGPADRLRAIRKAAAAFREEFLADPPISLRSHDLVGVPYPTRYALRDACTARTPLIQIRNRLFVARFRDFDGNDRILLGGPADHRGGNRKTPYFARLAARMGPRALRPLGERLVAPGFASVEECLKKEGISPDRVDYVTYDHLHTQDLRPWFGGRGKPGLLPNARLLVTRQEWASARALLPTQADWYCPDGTDGVDEARVIAFDTDVRVGPGLALLRTPGHTEGNHTLVFRTRHGIAASSENGVSPDAYAPERSGIPGLRRYARATGSEVVLNGNTLEGAVDQYLSMIQEKEIVDPSPKNPDFPNVLCSSELTAWPVFPGVRPTLAVGEVRWDA